MRIHYVLEVLGLVFLAMAAFNVAGSQRVNFVACGLFCWMLSETLLR